MNLEVLLANATEDERTVLAAIVTRIRRQPAVVVTMADRRRYVVDEDGMGLFSDVPDGDVDGEGAVLGGASWFGARWLRSPGKVDEMHRTLNPRDVRRVRRHPRTHVWGVD